MVEEKKKGMGKKKGVRWLEKKGDKARTREGQGQGEAPQAKPRRCVFGGWYSYVIITWIGLNSIIKVSPLRPRRSDHGLR